MRSPLLLLVTLVYCWATSVVDAKIVGAAVIPHGDFAYDPSLVDFKNGSLEIHKASIAVGHLIADLKPDIVFLSTPHGIAANNDFLIYQNTNGSGFALVGGDLHNSSFPEYKVPMNISMDYNLSTWLVDYLDQLQKNVSSLLSFADSEPTAIRWGEVIPLSFIREYLQENPQCHTVILSQPTRRYTQSVAMIPELLTLGALLNDLLEGDTLPYLADKRVVVIISSDLAHTHLASGPYGYSPDAEPFDKACGRWAATLDATALTVDAARYVDKALSCGFTGLVMLQGLIERNGQKSGTQWESRLLANFHPTYYGMMVASFLPKKQ